MNILLQPIATDADFDREVAFAIAKRRGLCERMVEAFVLAIWSRDFRNFSKV